MQLFAKSGINEVIADKDYPTVSLLNFALRGKAYGKDAEGRTVTTYDINVQMDINPFELLKLIKSTSKDNIINIINQLGYIRVTIDELTDGVAEDQKNILTLFANLDGSGKNPVILQFNGYKLVNHDASFGGVYDTAALEELVSQIKLPGKTAAEGGFDIGAIIDTIKGIIDFSGIADKTLTVDMAALITEIGGMVGTDMLNGFLGTLLNSEAAPKMSIVLESFEYGKCNAEFGYTDATAVFRSGNKSASAYKQKDFLKEITGIEGLPTAIDEGFTLSTLMKNGFSVKGNSFTQNGLTYDKALILSEEYEIKDGKYEADLIIGLQNNLDSDLLNLIDMGGSMIGITAEDVQPIFNLIRGAVKYHVSIPYKEYSEDMNFKVMKHNRFNTPSGEIPSEISMAVNDKNGLMYKLKGNLKNTLNLYVADADDTEYENARVYAIADSDIRILDADGKDVTDDTAIYDGKNILKAGTYKAAVGKGKYVKYVNVTVTAAA